MEIMYITDDGWAYPAEEAARMHEALNGVAAILASAMCSEGQPPDMHEELARDVAQRLRKAGRRIDGGKLRAVLAGSPVIKFGGAAARSPAGLDREVLK